MGTIEKLLVELMRFFQPLVTRIEDGQIDLLFAELGLGLPASAGNNNGFQNSLSTINENITHSQSIISELIQAIEAENTANILSKSIEATSKIKSTIDSFTILGNSLKNDLGAGSIGIPPAELDAFVSDLPGNLVNFLVVQNLENNLPALGSSLELFKVIERTDIPSNGNPAKPAFTKRTLKLGELKKTITNPVEQLSDNYDWGRPAFNGAKLFSTISKILINSGIPVLYDGASTPSQLNLIFADVGIDNSGTRPGVSIEPSVEARYIPEFIINQPGWEFKIGFIPDLGKNAKISIFPDGKIKLDSPSFSGATISAEWNAGFINRPFNILNLVGGSKVDAESFGIKIQNRLNSTGLGGTEFEANLQKLKILITLSEGDGFVSNVTSGSKIESELNLGFGYSTTSGLFIEGSGSIVINLPIHINLGPVELIGLLISVGLDGDEIPLAISTDIKVELGPLKAIIENIGLKASLTFPNDNTGNLGPANLSMGFKPPNGVGLSVEAGAVKGGGYLFFDYDRGEYAGALELVFSEWISLKAIGLINTKMPDGSDGFAMIIIITAEFGSGIQLGMGFTLLGVGGILGINRIVNVEPLRTGVRTGAIESVMFPQDVVANAPRIISDLRAFFPIQQDAFLVGPMAKIGYGTPTLVSVSIGLIIEFPDVNITILGVLKVVLPDENAEVLKLQVNFLGRIEPANSQLWFYAELYDSKILFITLEGGMGLLVNWGDNANFVFSIGGFHPKYNPPPLPFNEPPRLAVNILNESMAKIRIEGYFALTSNTVQFGARAELFFGFSALSVEGHLGFDALFQFDPFYFIFEFSAGLSVKVFGFGLFSISISGLLEGPTKWHIKGKAKWKIFFFGPTIKINIDETWGEEKQTELPPIEIFPLIEREFDAITNWEAVLPASKSISVSLRKLDEPSEGTSETTEEDTNTLVLHPVGKLRISQRKIPLKLRLDKLGNQRPSDVNKLSVTAAIDGGAFLLAKDVKEKFAEGEFKDLDKSKKLSSPGFENYDGGVELIAEGEQTKTSMAVKRVIRYETVIIDTNYKRHLIHFYEVAVSVFTGLFGRLFTHFLRGNTITKSTISATYKNRIQPNKEVIEVQPNLYTVAHKQNNRPVAIDTTSFTSRANALDYLQSQMNSNPVVASQMHVIPNTEVNTAA